MRLAGSSTVVENSNSFSYWLWENFLSYDKSFGDHTINIVAGMSAERSLYRYTNIVGGPMGADLESYSDFHYITSQDNDDIDGELFDDRKVSYFGRFTYGFKDRYLLQGSLRRDGASSSYLPKQGRWGIFPSVSAGWIVSNEEFLKNVPAVTYLKVRGSWGMNGSIKSLGNYLYAGALTSANLTYPAADGTFLIPIEPSQLDNPDLKWETSVQTDFGFDLRFFNDRLNFSADYYNKKTKDLLTVATPPYEAGNIAPYINAGDVENSGFEFELGWKEVVSEDISYSVNLNLATLHNEVTYLNPLVTRLNGAQVNGNSWLATAFEKGFPVWYFRGFKTNGIDPVTGDPVIVDDDENGTINTNDHTYLGSPHPDLIFGGNLSFNYKGFDLGVFLQGTYGNEIIMSFMRLDRQGINRMKIFYDDRWTPTNTDATMPRAGTDPAGFNGDLMIQDGSYLRVKEIQFGYTLPTSVLKTLKLKNLRAYASLENYITFTKYPGIDPEIGGGNSDIGVDRGFYPVPRRVILGATVTF